MPKNDETIYTYREFLQNISADIPDTEFNHYTKLETIEKIFSSTSSYWHVSSLRSMNDRMEADRYGNKSNSTFAMCFSCGASERIPMWYMYAGIGGAGARISFNKQAFSNFCNSIDVVYPIINKKTDCTNALKKGVDFDIECGYVCYCNFDNENRIDKIKHKSRRYIIKDSKMEEDAFFKDRFFIKNYEWEYENEYRIVFKMLKPLPEGIEKIAVPIDGIKNRISLTVGPEFSQNPPTLSGAIKQEFGDRIKHSRLKIKMDMLNRNKESFLAMPMSDFESGEISKMCDRIHNEGFCKHIDMEQKELTHV